MKKSSFLVVVVALLASALVVGAAPAQAVRSVGGSGTGHSASTRVVNVRDLPAVPRAGAKPKIPSRTFSDDTSRPKKPTTGTKPMPPSVRSSTSPRLASGTVATSFGIDEGSAACAGSCDLGTNTSAAVNGHEVMQVAAGVFQVAAERGFTLPGTCGAVTSLTSLLHPGGNPVRGARVQYDNLHRRFILTAVGSNFGSTPAIWVAASTSDEACGSWFVYRITFSGSAWPTTSNILQLVPGQDRNALLIGIQNNVAGNPTYSAFGIAKSQLFSGASVSFSTFGVQGAFGAPGVFAAPVTNAGLPMINTPVSYFVSAVANSGYTVYELTNSGGPGAALLLRATISSPFPPVPRLINQPNITAKLNSAGPSGAFTSSPVTDGTRIWFAHEAGISGFPTVRQGAITIAGNTVAAQYAYHSATSDDYNPSIAVGMNPGGTETVYLNWSYTDAPANVGTSNTVYSYLSTNGQVLLGTGLDVPTVRAGTTQVGAAFGGFSSTVDIDPGVPNGSCAVDTGMFWFGPFGWATNVSKIGNC